LGFATAATTYINVYAIRLGASNQLLGLRTSIPSLLVVLLRIPAAHLMERTSDRKTLIVRALAVGRFVYLLIFLLPWLGALPLLRQIPDATLFVGMVILISVPSVLSAAGWDSFFADVVPSGRRARVVGMRSTMTHVMMLTVVPLMGYFLDWVPFPLNYQIIFLLAFIGAMVSTWHVKRIQVDAPTTKAEASKPLNVQEARRIVRDSPEFGALLLGTFIYQWAVSLASPLFNVYFVEHLGASESWIGWRTTLASIASIVAYRFWPRRVEQLGERRVLTLAAPMMALFPLLTGLSQSLTPNLLIILIPRLFGSAVMLSRYGILLRVCPDDRRPTYIAIYAILANIAAFIAPMVGVNLVDWIGIRGVFFVSAGFRLTAALLYHRLPKIPVRDKVPAQG
jgi:MFS family permease